MTPAAAAVLSEGFARRWSIFNLCCVCVFPGVSLFSSALLPPVLHSTDPTNTQSQHFSYRLLNSDGRVSHVTCCAVWSNISPVSGEKLLHKHILDFIRAVLTEIQQVCIDRLKNETQMQWDLTDMKASTVPCIWSFQVLPMCMCPLVFSRFSGFYHQSQKLQTGDYILLLTPE